jgi:predicted N-acetyltransferase YhbS
VVLGRLAVDRRHQGQGLGRALVAVSGDSENWSGALHH